jgi:anti-sigma regulatory factor (Ser/Thr protein kinase)
LTDLLALARTSTELLDTDDHGVARVTEVRHAVASWLAARGVAQATSDTVVLVATELVTNAVRHTVGRVQVAIAEMDGEIVLHVFDESLELPNPLLAKPDDRVGHGLAIIDALADRWGAEHVTLHGRAGKIVWAAIRRAS